MDLIYANDQFDDVGVMQDYTMDMAYGLNENDFEIKKALQKPECEAGYYIYIEGTEYGGIIDAVGADTNENLLIYRGRTWHGILATKIIEPDAGYRYYTVSGEANAVVADIITRCDLGEIFDVSNEDSGIRLESFDFRYDDVNTGLFCMLYENDAKLIMRVKNGKVMLHVERAMNYATDEFDSSQVKFTLVETSVHCNHLICLGQGQGENRYVIHLFTDENGGILQYANSWDAENRTPTVAPIKDADYIRDLRVTNYPDASKIATGKHEYAAVYDYRDVAITENYEVLTTKPDDWDKDYPNYYEKSGEEQDQPEEEIGDNFTQIERNIQDIYWLLTSEPANWATNYTDYYTQEIDGEGNIEYNQVEGDEDPTHYQLLSSKPADWTKNFKNYYYYNGTKYKPVEKIPQYTEVSKRPKDWEKNYKTYYLNDGTGNFSPVPGDTKTTHPLLTSEPSTWAVDWEDFYVKYTRDNGNVGYHKLSEDEYYGKLNRAPKWKKNTFYRQSSKTIPPTWNRQVTYYSKKMVVPKWVASTYYSKDPTTFSKTWAANTYYQKQPDVDVGVEFMAEMYFKKVEDHFAELVAGGIDQLAELNDRDELVLSLKGVDGRDINGDYEFEEVDNILYDIGDIVGGVEHITGVSTQQPITKKIVNVIDNLITVQHEVK